MSENENEVDEYIPANSEEYQAGLDEFERVSQEYVNDVSDTVLGTDE